MQSDAPSALKLLVEVCTSAQFSKERCNNGITEMHSMTYTFTAEIRIATNMNQSAKG